MTGRQLIVDACVRERFPTYRALVVHATTVTNGSSDDASAAALRNAERRARRRLGDASPNRLPEIAAWRAATAAFGLKPSRYPCSAEALLKRVARGDEIPSINRLVDVYNATSLAYAIPLGGEDADAVRGDVRLVFARGDEAFDNGQPPLPGEVIWRDDLGATCRAWNWRQGTRTRIGERATNVYFLLEAIDQQGASVLAAAAAELSAQLTAATVTISEVASPPAR
jgi:DNA/RNA-binding domain of Phe-tRNA-synthetase-like protein